MLDKHLTHPNSRTVAEIQRLRMQGGKQHTMQGVQQQAPASGSQKRLSRVACSCRAQRSQRTSPHTLCRSSKPASPDDAFKSVAMLLVKGSKTISRVISMIGRYMREIHICPRVSLWLGERKLRGYEPSRGGHALPIYCPC